MIIYIWESSNTGTPQSSNFASGNPCTVAVIGVLSPRNEGWGSRDALFTKLKGVILCSFQIHIWGPRAECARLGVLGRKEWCDMNCLYAPLLYVCYIRGFNSLCNYDIYYHSCVYKQKTIKKK